MSSVTAPIVRPVLSTVSLRGRFWAWQVGAVVLGTLLLVVSPYGVTPFLLGGILKSVLGVVILKLIAHGRMRVAE